MGENVNKEESIPENFSDARGSESTYKIANRMGGQECALAHSAAMMYHLGQLLWVNDKKFRVTIECDPETGRFKAKREEFA